MDRGRHLTAAGFASLLEVAMSMNGGGRVRQVRWNEIAAVRGA